MVCGRVTYAKYDVPGSKKLGENIAEEFDKGYNTVMMENHGVVCGHKDLPCAYGFRNLGATAEARDRRQEARFSPGPEKGVQIAVDREKAITRLNLDHSFLEAMLSEERGGRRDMWCELIH